jgi:hypothetical protein
MAVPSAPTLLQLVTEGLALANQPNMLARARGTWMRQIKNEIADTVQDLKIMQKTEVSVTEDGRERYANPTDFLRDMELVLLKGSVTGIATGGTSTTITLATDFSSAEDDLKAKKILVTGGTGKNSLGQVTAYNDTTKVATVGIAFTTTPVNTDTYLIVENEIPLIEMPKWRKNEHGTKIERREPSHFFPLGDEDEDEFVLFPVPDKSTYGLVKTYYADIRKVDLTDSWMGEIYREFEEVFVLGIKARATDSDTDWLKYNQRLGRIRNDSYGVDFSNLQMTLSQ